MNRLITGPWVGELGWQLMSWQGFIRRIAPRYKEVIVCCPRGHEALYSDFTKNFITHTIGGRKDKWNLVDTAEKLDHSKLRMTLLRHHGTQLQPCRYIPPCDQKFVKYGVATNATQSFDVLLHARLKLGKQPYRAWDTGDCDQVAKGLRQRGLSVAAIGTEAYAPPGVTDLRNTPLKALMDIMAASKLLIGPTSGPMPLAALCGLQFLTWCTPSYKECVHTTDRDRLENLWNPFKTNCRVLDQYGWRPTPDVLIDNAEKMLCLQT